jgi:hypothetical protein
MFGLASDASDYYLKLNTANSAFANAITTQLQAIGFLDDSAEHPALVQCHA